jgi:transcriptional regulator GlxA family with amidase domain
MRDFTVVVLEGAYATSVAVTLDMLAAAAALAPRLGLAVPTWRLVSAHGGPVQLRSGLSVDTAKLSVRSSNDRSVWVVPGVGLDTPTAIQQRFGDDDVRLVLAALRRHAKTGSGVAASCSAVFLLQAAGLLEGRRVTTSWWLAPLLKRLAPECTVDADRMVCADGPIVTAGAAFAQTDLMLYLLRAHGGNALADQVSRVLLVDGRQAQAPFIVPEVFSSGDDLIGRLAARIEAALPEPPKVGQLAREFCMSERTLARHIKRATGMSTLALVQSVRQRRARALLGGSRMTIEQVAVAVGYQDATALRRMMKRFAGANPSRFRTATALA